MSKVLVFINPTSRQGAKCADEVIAWLTAHRFEVLNLGYDPAHDQMSEWIERFVDQSPVVIVGGGDGSVNHALPSLLKTKLRLLLIPLGTANNLARTLGLSTVTADALSLLIDGRVETIDVGIVRPQHQQHQNEHASKVPEMEIPFVNVIGIGMSARVNRAVASEHKKWFGAFAFVWTLFRVAARMTPFRVAIECDGQKHHGHSWQITVCNGKNYGNGLTVDPTATLQDETLHGLSTEIGKWWHGFGLLPAFRAGRFVTTPEVVTFSGRVVKITTKHAKHVDVDGDLKARTPIEISVRARALQIYVPSRPSRQVSS